MLLEPGIFRLVGRAAAGKTTFALDQVRQHLALGHRVLWLGASRSVALREKMGVKSTPKLMWLGVESLEDALQVYIAMTECGGIELVVFDDLAGRGEEAVDLNTAVFNSAFAGGHGVVLLAGTHDINLGENVVLNRVGIPDDKGVILHVLRAGVKTEVAIAYVLPKRQFTLYWDVTVRRCVTVEAPSLAAAEAWDGPSDDEWEECGSPEWGPCTIEEESVPVRCVDIRLNEKGERIDETGQRVDP